MGIKSTPEASIYTTLHLSIPFLQLTIIAFTFFWPQQVN